MRLMRTALLLLVGFASAPARADDVPSVAPGGPGNVDTPTTTKSPPFAWPRSMRVLFGLGSALQGGGGETVVTAEFAAHTLSGAFSTGLSVSTAEDFGGRWNVSTLGVFGKLDVTYLILGCGWLRDPSTTFPVRLQVGARFGIGVSTSLPATGTVDPLPPYVLIRPELEPFVDVEVPIFPDRTERRYSLVFRFGADAPTSLNSFFRLSASVGLSYGWAGG
jgi:hypothetical protein